MSRHSTSFEVERAVPAEVVQELLPPENKSEAAAPAPLPAISVARKGAIKRILMAGTAVALLGGRRLVWLGLLDRRPVSGLDRRRLCEGRQHHHRAKGLRLSQRRAGRRQRARHCRADVGADRRSRLQGGARTGQGRCCRGRGRARQQAGATRRPAGRDRSRQGNASRSTPRPRRSLVRRTSAIPIWPLPVTAACRTRNPRNRATPAHRPQSCATPPTLLRR